MPTDSQEALAADSLLYAGDVVESGPGSTAGLVLLDGTTLAIDENASIVLDELIYEPGSGEGQLSISVLNGVFSLTSGEPSDLVINSPLAVAGVRGTHVGLKVSLEDGGEQWFLLPNGAGGESGASPGFVDVTLDIGGARVTWFNFARPEEDDDDATSEPPNVVAGGGHDDGDDHHDDVVGDGIVRLGPGGGVFNGTRGSDTAFGGTGADVLRGNGGDDLLDGGDGRVTVVYSSATEDIEVDLEAGTATGDPILGEDVLRGIENIVGDASNDVLRGDGRDNILRGEGGNDVLEGGGGDDLLVGGPGRDTSVFSGAFDRYEFVEGDGTLIVSDTADTDGTDTLSRVETLVFADRVVILNQGGINDPPIVDVGEDHAVFVNSVPAEHDLSEVPAFTPPDPDDPNGVDQDALTLEFDHVVTMLFVSGATDQSDIVGTYNIAADGTIANVRIVFANASDLADDPTPGQGQGQAILDVGAGERLGIFVVANGFDLNDLAGFGAGEFRLLDSDGSPATTATNNPRLVHMAGNVLTEIKAADDGIYHTAGASLNVDGEEHVASGVDNLGGLILSFEIEPPGIDFDDLVVRLTFAPVETHSLAPVAIAPDLVVSDPEGDAIRQAVVTLDQGFAGDRLVVDPALVAAAGLALTDEGTRLVISGLASTDTYDDVLSQIGLASDDAALGERLVSFVLRD